MARTLVTGNILRSGSIPTTALGGGVVTSSLQIVASLPTGSLSSSAQVNYPDISNIPGGIASSSAQIKDYLPVDTVSSSAQVTAFLPTGTVSSSTQLPSGIASSSAQVTAYLPTGTVSSSGQISVFNTINGDQLATTGSNTFTAPQTISDTTNSTSYLDGALHVVGGMSVRKDVRISGSMTVNGLLTAVSMSTQYVTSSEYVVGTSRITLNDDDNVRFAGLSIIDSGSSSPTSASIFWDSLQHRFIYENLSGSAYNSSIIIAGPKHTGSLGDEPTLTSGYIPYATGTDHIDNSVMFQSSSNIGIGTTNPSNPLTVSSTGNTIAPIGLIDTQASGRTWFINNGFPAVGHFSLYDGTAAATRLTIDTSGRLLIGLTSNNTSGPVQALVNGTGTSFQTNPAVFGAVTTVAGREVPMIYGTDGTNTALVSMLSGSMAFFTQGTARLTIDASGNVGIGTTVVDTGVSVDIQNRSAVSSNVLVRIRNTTLDEDAGLIIDGNSSGTQREYRMGIHTIQNTPDLTFSGPTGFRWFISGSEKMCVTGSTGNVGIGSTNPGRKLVVYGTGDTYASIVGGTTSVASLLFGDTSSDSVGRITYDNSDDSLTFLTNNGNRMRINSSGNVGIGITNPGVRLHISGSSAGEANIISTIGNLEFYKDATPSRAYGIGMSPVGGSITDDLVFTSYNGSWSEKVRFTNAGRVGIGTITPTGSLDANGPIVARAAGGFSSDALDNIGSVPFVARLSLDSTFLGAINQYGYQAFAVNIDGSANASNTRGRVDFYTKTDGNWRTALTLNNGSVGIGSTSPGYKLDISGSGDVQQRIGSTGTDAGLMMAGSRNYILYSGKAGSGVGTGNFSIYDATAGLARLTISGSGNVGIGTTNPSEKLHVYSDTGTYLLVRGANANLASHFALTHGGGGGRTGVDGQWNISFASANTDFGATPNLAGGLAFWHLDGGTTNDVMRLKTDKTAIFAGNVGIGTAAPLYKLGVNVSNPANGVVAQFYDNATTNASGSFVLVTQYGVADWFIGQPSAVNALTFGNGKTSSTAGTEYVRIDSSGRVTLPYQPSFKAGRSGGQTYSANATIIFNSEFYDIGGHYNTSTGVFTAPVSGTYIFTATVLVESSATGYEYDFNIVTSNETYFGAPGRTEYQAGTSWGDGYIAFGVYHLAYMDANDTAKITFSKFDGGAIYGGTTWTNFAGMLIG